MRLKIALTSVDSRKAEAEITEEEAEKLERKDIAHKVCGYGGYGTAGKILDCAMRPGASKGTVER
jgi:hypothetical protein